MKKLFAVSLVCLTTLSLSYAAQYTGTETSVGVTKIDACKSARSDADHKMTNEINLLKHESKNSKIYNGKVEGCSCTQDVALFTCMATWSIEEK